MKRRQPSRRRLSIALPVKGWRKDPLDTFREAILHWVEMDATDPEGWHRAWARVRVAARRWVQSEKPKNRYRKSHQNEVHTPLDTEPSRVAANAGRLNSQG